MRCRSLAVVMAVWLAGCAGGGGPAPSSTGQGVTSGGGAAAPAQATGGGRYAMSGDAYPLEPPDVSRVSDAVPRLEAPSRAGNRPTYQVWGKTYHVLPDARGYARQGTASWYGEKFHGYATSNGEIYDMYKMTAAHRSLPLPSYVRVTSLDNGRSVIVRVNDRGPFHNDREIDLSYAAAARLDILQRGTGRVKVEAIDVEQWLAENGQGGGRQVASAVPAATPAPRAQAPEPAVASAAPVAPASAGGSGQPVYLQVAALGSADNARALKARLQGEISHPIRVDSGTGMHRVQVGPIAHAGQVEPLRDELRRAGIQQAFIVNGAE